MTRLSQPSFFYMGQETGCDNGMLIAVYKCLFGIVRTVADD